nr:DUF2842 domain-containing protein [uncultured Sphingomonas sp.]
MNEPSWKKPVGIFLIIALIIVWAVAVASLSNIVGKWHMLAQGVFYLIAGIAWVFPLKPLLRWMETPPFKD